MSRYTVCVLTVSDTASQNASADQSGPKIVEILNAHESYNVKESIIVSDDVDEIRRAVKNWSARGSGVDWIITTGGTGFGVRDLTPEAITPLLHRQAPGLVHLILAKSLDKTPFGALSRLVAGTASDTLIVTLPGSVKAVSESMNIMLAQGVVGHALDLIKGGSGAAVHQALSSSVLQPEHSHHEQHHEHQHHHHRHHDHGGSDSHGHTAPQPRSILSHDPSLPVTARHRISPYPIVSFEEAMGMIISKLSPLSAVKKRVGPHLKGYVLAEDVYAPHDIPTTRTTSADGYATKSSRKPGIYKVVSSTTHKIKDPLPEGVVYRINTGGPLPLDTDTIVMVEDTRLISSLKDGALGHEIEELEIETLADVSAGENVRQPGSDVKQGDAVLQRGDILRSTGGEIGTLAFVGRTEVNVVQKPVIAILSTGNELLDLQNPIDLSKDEWGGVWDTNRPSLQSALEGFGYEVVDIGIVPDDIESHVGAIKRGLEVADVLLTTGGTSMGASDLLKPIIERHLNGVIHFGRVKVKPGKPTTFATIPAPGSDREKVFFALPGNPASAIVTFHIFVIPALRRLGGWKTTNCQFPLVKVKLSNAMRIDPRVEFHRAIIRVEADGLHAYSTGGQRSSRVASLNGANGLVKLPAKTADVSDVLEAGAEAQALIIGELQMA